MILVTGGTGLVGAHLLLHLAQSGAALRALYRNKSNISKTKNIFSHYGKSNLFDTIEWVKGDVTDVPSLEEAFAGIEYVYHAAALISFDAADEEKLRKINIEGTANMVNCALAHGIKKFCHISSIAALGDLKHGETVITEATEWNPEKGHSDYAISKHGAEMEGWRAWQEGLNVVVINPGIIFGYGFWEQGSGKIFTSIKQGQRHFTKGICGVVAIEDVAAIALGLMEKSTSGERFILVADNIQVQELLNLIADGMGKKRPSVYATPLLTSIAWRADWILSKLFLRERTLTRAIARAAHTTETFDNSKIKTELRYNFKDMKNYLKDLAAKFIREQE